MTDDELVAIFAAGNSTSTAAALRAVFDAGKNSVVPEKGSPISGKFQVYKNRDKFRWRYLGGNGEIVASGEGYTRKAKAQQAISILMGLNAAVEVEDLTKVK